MVQTRRSLLSVIIYCTPPQRMELHPCRSTLCSLVSEPVIFPGSTSTPTKTKSTFERTNQFPRSRSKHVPFSKATHQFVWLASCAGREERCLGGWSVSFFELFENMVPCILGSKLFVSYVCRSCMLTEAVSTRCSGRPCVFISCHLHMFMEFQCFVFRWVPSTVSKTKTNMHASEFFWCRCV